MKNRLTMLVAAVACLLCVGCGRKVTADKTANSPAVTGSKVDKAAHADDQQVFVPCEFHLSFGSYFTEGRCPVQQGKKWGFVDRTAKLVIPCEFDTVESFSEGLAVVQRNGKYGYIDRTGKQVIPCQFDYAYSFSEGLAEVGQGRTPRGRCERHGFIDKTGELVIPYQFDDVDSFSEGLAAVRQGLKWGFIDRDGKLVIPCQFIWVSSFKEGLAVVMQNGKQGFIDKTGKLVIACQFEFAWSFSEGLAYVQQNGKYGYVDRTGKLLIPCQFAAASLEFSEGFCPVMRGKNWGYIDKTGKEVIPCQFDGAGRFLWGLAGVKRYARWGAIDKTGKLVLTYRFGSGVCFYEGLAAVHSSTQWSGDSGFLVNPLVQWDGERPRTVAIPPSMEEGNAANMQVHREKACRELIEAWLTAMKSGEDTAIVRYWHQTELAQSVNAVKSWELVSLVLLDDERAEAVVETESSPETGPAVRKKWSLHLSEFPAGWHLDTMSAKEPAP